jgi:hypothetical protein
MILECKEVRDSSVNEDKSCLFVTLSSSNYNPIQALSHFTVSEENAGILKSSGNLLQLMASLKSDGWDLLGTNAYLENSSTVVKTFYFFKLEDVVVKHAIESVREESTPQKKAPPPRRRSVTEQIASLVRSTSSNLSKSSSTAPPSLTSNDNSPPVSASVTNESSPVEIKLPLAHESNSNQEVTARNSFLEVGISCDVEGASDAVGDESTVAAGGIVKEPILGNNTSPNEAKDISNEMSDDVQTGVATALVPTHISENPILLHFRNQSQSLLLFENFNLFYIFCFRLVKRIRW